MSKLGVPISPALIPLFIAELEELHELIVISESIGEECDEGQRLLVSLPVEIERLKKANAAIRARNEEA